MDFNQESSNSLVRTFSRDSEVRQVSHKHLLGAAFLTRLTEQKENQRFCDIRLKIKNEIRSIYAHKVILASFSDYFAAMFNPKSSMIEKELEEIELELPNFSFDIFKLILDYAYSGEVKITCENVEDLTTGARFFDISLLMEECGKFMEDNIEGENCLGMLAFADVNNLKHLRLVAMDFARSNFEEVYNSNELLFLSPKTLRDLLNTGTLLIKLGITSNGENFVFDMVLSYIQTKSDLTAEEITFILCQVKLPYIEESKLEHLQRVTVVQNIPRCVELIERALMYKRKDTEPLMEEHWIHKRLFAEIRYTSYPALAAINTTTIEPQTFNDQTWIQDGKQMTGINMWIRRWDGRGVLGGLEVFYNGISTGVHGSNDGELHQLTLLPGEFITSAKLCSGWLVDSMTFMTDKGNIYGPYGGDGGGQWLQKPAHDLKLKESQVRLAYFKGKIVSTQGSLAIIKLYLYWAYEANANAPEIPIIAPFIDNANDDNSDDEYDDDMLE